MSETNWAKRGKTQAAAVPLTNSGNNATNNGGGKMNERGKRYEATVAKFGLASFSTGSFGLKIAYALNGHKRNAYENIVLATLNADGVLTPTKYGESSLKRRLAAFGIPSEQILVLGTPKTPRSEFNVDVIGAPVAVYLATREYMGKEQFDVKGVFPLGDEPTGNTAA